MIPYSRPKLSDLYTLYQSKLLENHTPHSGTYLYSPYMAVSSPPPGKEHSIRSAPCLLTFILPLQTNPRSFLVANYPGFHSFRTWWITRGITCWDICTCVPSQQMQIKLGVLYFFHRKPNIFSSMCILLEVFIILVASNTMLLEIL